MANMSRLRTEKALKVNWANTEGVPLDQLGKLHEIFSGRLRDLADRFSKLSFY